MTDLIARCDASRDFPRNTCGASRHAQMIGEQLLDGNPWWATRPERIEAGESILATVAALWEARTQLGQQRLEGKW